MSRRELIAALESQAEGIRLEAETRMTVLLDAARELQALEDGGTTATAAPAKVDKPSIASLVLGIFTAEPNKVFDAPIIRQKLLDANPEADAGEVQRIRNGIHAAIQALKGKKKIRLAPGGYELTPPGTPVPA